MNLTNKILIIGLTSVFATGCTHTDAISDTFDINQVLVPITLNIDISQALNIASPASRYAYDCTHNPAPRRPVSWKGEQSINDMRVYVFESDNANGEYIYTGGGEGLDGGYIVDEFHNLTPWKSNDNSNESESHTFSFTPKLTKGKYYKFLAIGRDDKDTEFPIIKDDFFVDWGSKAFDNVKFKVGETNLKDAKLNNCINPLQYPYISTEIFSGLMTYIDLEDNIAEDYVYVDEQTVGFNKDITLHRAVAALWAYFTDIPNMAVDNTENEFNGMPFKVYKLSVLMSASPTSINLFNYKYDYKYDEESINRNIIVAVTDFTNMDGEKVNLWSTDTDQDDYWKRDAYEDYYGIEIASNSVLMTNYLMPIDPSELLEDNVSTFRLNLSRQYLNDKQFFCNIKCHIENVYDVKTGETRPYEGDPYHFPIMANCIYAIGNPDQPFSLSVLNMNDSRSGGPEEIDIPITCIQ